MSEKIFLIDGNSMTEQMFYSLPDQTDKENRHQGAVRGFMKFFLKLLEEKPDHLAVVFEAGEPVFRHKDHPMPESLKEQIFSVKQMLKDMNVFIAEQDGYKAEDLAGTIAEKYSHTGFDVTVFSADRKFLQLAGEHICIRMPDTAKGGAVLESLDREKITEKYGITPEQVADLMAFTGDGSSCVPGIPGIGEKLAVRILREFGSLENAYAHEEELFAGVGEILKSYFEQAQRWKENIRIRTDCPLEISPDRSKAENISITDMGVSGGNTGLQGEAQEPEKEKLEYFTCEDFQGMENLFAKAAEREWIGISLAADKNEIYGAGLALGRDEIYYIPVGGLITGEYLRSSISILGEKAVLCAMDVKTVLKHISVKDPSRVFDAGVGAYLLDPLRSDYDCRYIAEKYLDGMEVPSREELIGKASFGRAWEEDVPGLGTLLSYLAYIPVCAREPILNSLEETGMKKVYTDIELPLIFTLDSMEKSGIRVKGEELKVYGEKLMSRILELEKKIWEEAGEGFNINSPKQLGVILFEKLGLSGGKKTKTGYSTAADILDKLAPEHEIIRDILEYRQLAKLKSTYADGLGNVIEEDGRIHSTFNQTITATGRISSTEPNLQNIPVRMELGRQIRKVFVPDDGYVVLDADYSQIELRVLAHMSGDEKLIQAYREAEDIHRLTASQVFHVPLDEVTPLQRRNAKAVNFGIVYGISSFGLSQDLSITRKEAAEYIEKYFETYPSIKGFLDGLVETGKEKGYVSTMFGRRRPVPELKSSKFMQRSFGERVAMNSPIQGTAADIIKIAMNRVYERLKEENLSSRLVLQVHDELLIETKKEEAEEVSRILEEEMKGAAQLKVELEVDMHQGKNWYEAK